MSSLASTLTHSASRASGVDTLSGAEYRRVSGYTNGRCCARRAKPPCCVNTCNGVGRPGYDNNCSHSPFDEPSERKKDKLNISHITKV